MRIIIFITFLLISLCHSAYSLEFTKIDATDKHPEIWYMQTKEVPKISVKVSFPSGYAFDPHEKLGLATLAAATMDEGAGKLTSDDFQQALSDYQISLYYRASPQRLTLNLGFLKFDTQKAIDLAQLSLKDPRFDSEIVELMRQKIADSIVKAQQSPSYIASQFLRQHYYQEHPFSNPSKGFLSTINRITPQDLVEYHQNLSLKDAFISIVGDLSKQEAINMASTLVKDMPSNNSEKPTIPEFTPDPVSKRLHIYYDVPQTTLIMTTPAVKRHSTEFFATYIATHILGGGNFGAYLVDNLREKKGLTYSISAYLDSSSYDGRMLIQFATDNKTVMPAISEVEKTLQHLVNKGITQKELDQAKLYLKGQYALSFETNNDIASLAQGLFNNNLDYDYPQKRNELFDAVTLEDVNTAMQKIFKQPLTIVAISGNKQIDDFKKISIKDIPF